MKVRRRSCVCPLTRKKVLCLWRTILSLFSQDFHYCNHFSLTFHFRSSTHRLVLFQTSTSYVKRESWSIVLLQDSSLYNVKNFINIHEQFRPCVTHDNTEFYTCIICSFHASGISPHGLDNNDNLLNLAILSIDFWPICCVVILLTTKSYEKGIFYLRVALSVKCWNFQWIIQICNRKIRNSVCLAQKLVLAEKIHRTKSTAHAKTKWEMERKKVLTVSREWMVYGETNTKVNAPKCTICEDILIDKRSYCVPCQQQCVFFFLILLSSDLVLESMTSYCPEWCRNWRNFERFGRVMKIWGGSSQHKWTKAHSLLLN